MVPIAPLRKDDDSWEALQQTAVFFGVVNVNKGVEVRKCVQSIPERRDGLAMDTDAGYVLLRNVGCA
jgi:hypothetical protein